MLVFCRKDASKVILSPFFSTPSRCQGYQGMCDGGDHIKELGWSDVSNIIQLVRAAPPQGCSIGGGGWRTLIMWHLSVYSLHVPVVESFNWIGLDFGCTVWPLLSGHSGTISYPDYKAMWPDMGVIASSIGFIGLHVHVIIYSLLLLTVVWNGDILNTEHFVLFWASGHEWKYGQYTCMYCKKEIEIYPDNWWSDIKLRSKVVVYLATKKARCLWLSCKQRTNDFPMDKAVKIKCHVQGHISRLSYYMYRKPGWLDRFSLIS